MGRAGRTIHMMINELFMENYIKIRITLIGFCMIILLLVVYQSLFRTTIRKNDETVLSALQGVTYTESRADRELEKLQEVSKLTPLSVKVKSRLYSAMAETAYMVEDDMQYNKYIADALFYAEYTKDEEQTIYLTNKYIGRLYANGCYQSAENLLDNLKQSYNMENFSPELQAEYYLSCADVAQMNQKDSTGNLKKAQEIIASMQEGSARELYLAKLNILIARELIEQGEFAEAEAMMRNYSVEDAFGMEKDQVYVVCDYRIPFYEISTKLELRKGNEEKAYYYADKYLEACDDFRFRAMKVRLLQYILSYSNQNMENAGSKYYRISEEASRENLTELSEGYGKLLLLELHNEMDTLSGIIQKEQSLYSNGILFLGTIYCAMLLFCIGSILFDYMDKDGLTRLNSRKKYEKDRTVLEKKKTPYCLIIFDIDDFKQVNDTFGHEVGDDVLRKISQIMRTYIEHGISVYRYGGEELCMVLRYVPREHTCEIAEEIRILIETTVGSGENAITVSGGIGVSNHGEDVFQDADRKLYEAKARGKNQVRCG